MIGLSAIVSIGKRLIQKPDGRPSGAKITAVVVAGAGLIGAVLVSLGASPELAEAVQQFIEAIGLLAIGG